MIPLGRLRTCSGLISGTTSGTSGSIRNAPELSTTITPRAAASGAHSAATSSGTSNMATSIPSKTSGDSSWTASDSPRTINSRPAERLEATTRMSPQTFFREASNPHITVPTAPVAPIPAKLGKSLIEVLPSGSAIDDGLDITTEVECVVHRPDGSVEVGIAADDRHPDLRG